jgi:hypothetical protein
MDEMKEPENPSSTIWAKSSIGQCMGWEAALLFKNLEKIHEP